MKAIDKSTIIGVINGYVIWVKLELSMISEDDHEQNMKKLNLLKQKIENFKNTFNLIISSREVRQPTGFGEEIEDAIEAARVFPRDLFDQVKAYAQRMRSIDEDKAFGLDRIIEEIETYNSALLENIADFINTSKSKDNILKHTPIKSRIIRAKLRELVNLHDENYSQNRKEKGTTNMIYQDFQMDSLKGCLLTRSKNRSKFSLSVFWGWGLGYNNGSSLVNKINDEIKKLKTNKYYYQERVTLDSERLLLLSSKEYYEIQNQKQELYKMRQEDANSERFRKP